MSNSFGFGQKATGQVERKPSGESDFSPKGYFDIQLVRKGKVIESFRAPNGVTNVGKNSILGVGFNAIAQITAWYLGIIDNSGFSALAAADTMASHAGWNEFVSYAEATRVAWPEDAASGQQITNSTSADFNINGSGTLNGIFLVSDNVKSGTAGTLWATASFASTIPVLASDVLKITYTITAT